ncbi:MAG: UTP--glucose-1-phosphate uridylyltransferase [Syntrophomonadaceae bacterium]|nr:UTP--glucose-1-phosphate uridylyltransferase [Syntrophomonadaceae bacterium]
MLVRKAVIPAGGWGTRFLPATKAQPKEMLPIVDKPAIQYVVEEAVESGISEIFIVTRIDKPVFLDHFTPFIALENHLLQRGENDLLALVKSISHLTPKIRFILQEEARGLGDAINFVSNLIGNEPFAVLLPDNLIQAQVPCLKQMIDLYEKLRSPLIAVDEVEMDIIHQYGVINPENRNYPFFLIKDLIEKPTREQSPSNLAIVGRYILTPAIFPLLAQAIPGIGDEIQLTDSLRILAHQEKIYGFHFMGTHFDVGDKLGFIKANLALGLQRTDLGPELQRFIVDLVNNMLTPKTNQPVWPERIAVDRPAPPFHPLLKY